MTFIQRLILQPSPPIMAHMLTVFMLTAISKLWAGIWHARHAHAGHARHPRHPGHARHVWEASERTISCH